MVDAVTLAFFIIKYFTELLVSRGLDVALHSVST